MWKSSTPVLVEPGELSDPVALLEAQHELLRRVVGGLELVEPKEEAGSLFAEGEVELGLDVVSPVELGALAQHELPTRPRHHPILEGGGEDREVLVDVDVHDHVSVLPGSRARPNLKRSHETVLPARGGGKPEP
jgi:hypothetical protein